MTLLNVQWCSGVETRASHFSHFLHGETACGPIQLFFYWFFVSTRKTYAPVYKINKDRAGSEAITPTIVSLPTEEILPRLGIQGVNKTERDRRIRRQRFAVITPTAEARDLLPELQEQCNCLGRIFDWYLIRSDHFKHLRHTMAGSQGGERS